MEKGLSFKGIFVHAPLWVGLERNKKYKKCFELMELAMAHA